MRILTVNVGSSSLKLSLVDDGRVASSETLPAPWGPAEKEAVARSVGSLEAVDAVGHRVVHGGPELVAPVRLDAEVRRRLETLVDLAPLHMRASLDAADFLGWLLPDVLQVACFDTAFHSGMPAAASTYAVPMEWSRRYSIRRYGFHGLSHAWAARRVADISGRPATSLRTVTCHLGAGASLAAVSGGRSVDTTMGFTPLEGVVMATRAGSVDPGLLLWLEEHAGMTPGDLAHALEHSSGLLGLAGSADMRIVLEREATGDEGAALAVAVYLNRLRAGIATMAAAMGGLDALAFTGGVGEHAAPIRRRAVEDLEFLGLGVDEGANATAEPDVEITGAGALARTFVIAAHEDLQIAREVEHLLSGRRR